MECWPGPEEPTQDRYLEELSAGGWNARYLLCYQIRIDGELFSGPFCGAPFPDDPIVETLSVPCEGSDNTDPTSLLGHEVNVANGQPGPLGEWVFRIWQENPPGTETDSARVIWLVAETCEVEFVPEPGTILLLGSGLMGLAGYAGLRWRTRE